MGNRSTWTDSVCRMALNTRLVRWVTAAMSARASTLVNKPAASQQRCTSSCRKPASIRRLMESRSFASFHRQVPIFIAAARRSLCLQTGQHRLQTLSDDALDEPADNITVGVIVGRRYGRGEPRSEENVEQSYRNDLTRFAGSRLHVGIG